MESLSPQIQELTADILTGIVDGVVVTDAPTAGASSGTGLPRR